MSLASQVALLATRIATEIKNRSAITVMQRGDVNTSVNLNTLTVPGMYRITNAFVSGQYGLDSAYHYGVLMVYNAGNGALVQEYFEDGNRNMYYRAAYGGSFTGSSWSRVTGTVVTS